MRVIRIAALGGIILWFTLVSAGSAELRQPSAGLIKEAVKALEAGKPGVARERLQEVLTRDAHNYTALVLLGQLEMEDPDAPDAARRLLDSEYHLLLAALLQPQRPDAYLALAQLGYSTGYVQIGDYYAAAAQAVDPKSYEAFCLRGQRYEDTGNFAAALDCYSQGLNYYPFDSYLMGRRYIAAASGGLRPQWTYRAVTAGKAPVVLLLRRYPDFYLLNEYRQEAGKLGEGGRPYSLPMFTFNYCPRERAPVSPYRDLYEAFIKASVDDPAQYRTLRAELDGIRKEALKAMSQAQGPEAKGRALYDWLKTNFLREYDQQNGVLAQDLLTKRRFISLNASILYTLIGREAGLQVQPVIDFGHAFPTMGDGQREIRIELLAQPRFGLPEKEGFDAGWWDQFKVATQAEALGEIEEEWVRRKSGPVAPSELTAYQFLAVNTHNLDRIRQQYKGEVDFKRTLEATLIRKKREMAARLSALTSWYQRESEKYETLVDETYSKFAAEKTKLQRDIDRINSGLEKEKAQYLAGKGLDLIKKAGAVAPPGAEDFAKAHEDIYMRLAAADLRPVLDAENERNRRRTELEEKLNQALAQEELARTVSGSESSSSDSGARSVDAINAGLQAVLADEAAGWNSERTAWLKAITRLEKGVQEIPCGDNIKRRLESLCWTTVKLAERYNDTETAEEVIRAGVSRLPESEFARQYRQRQ